MSGLDPLSGLMAPDQILAVVAETKHASFDLLAIPSTNMPRSAEGDAARVELTVLVFDPEMHLAFQLVVDCFLIERDHIGFCFDGFQ